MDTNEKLRLHEGVAAEGYFNLGLFCLFSILHLTGAAYLLYGMARIPIEFIMKMDSWWVWFCA